MINWKSKTIPLVVSMLAWPEFTETTDEVSIGKDLLLFHPTKLLSISKKIKFSGHIRWNARFLLCGCQDASHQDQIRSTERWKRDKSFECQQMKTERVEHLRTTLTRRWFIELDRELISLDFPIKSFFTFLTKLFTREIKQWGKKN